MDADGAVLGTAARCGQLCGGRADATFLLLPADQAWPPSVCQGLPGLGEHYVHEALEPGLYVWAGSCREHDCSPLPGTPNG